MKKVLFLLLFLPLFCTAQLKEIAEGPGFEEPESGFGKIILMKSGNTVFLHITLKDGINIRIYNPKHQQIVSKNLKPAYGNLKRSKVEGVYDINGTITAFISELDEKRPTLYKLRIDGETGNLIDEVTIGMLDKISLAQGYAVAFGGVPIPDFLVRKDPASDNYGLIKYNTFETDNTKRVELIQYAPDGSEAQKTYLSSPGGKYKYTQILDFVLVGNVSYALLYSYNTAKSGGAGNELLFATIKDGHVTYTNVGKSIAKRINEGILRYNPQTGNFIFLTLEMTTTEQKAFSNKRTTYYAINLNVINGNDHSNMNSIDALPSTASRKYNKIFKEDNGYNGMPQQLYINNDGSISILFEEIALQTTSSGPGYGFGGGFGPTFRQTASSELLGTAAIVTLNENGQEGSTELIPKSYKLFYAWYEKVNQNMYLGSNTIAERDNGATPLSGGNQFKKIAYLDGKSKSYILLNDVEENEDRIQKGKLTTIQSVGDCQAYIYDLANATTIAKPILPRKLAFTKTGNKERNLAIFAISDFDRETGTFATLKFDKKNVKVVWMQE
ncbi:MAG TPA: hypothetical protein VL098_01325 [Flavipsychrobacter sp.]|nr:hypothetical protein [Flavipsychrobacter sp.]